jgi:hypothetical protein
MVSQPWKCEMALSANKPPGLSGEPHHQFEATFVVCDEPNIGPVQAHHVSGKQVLKKKEKFCARKDSHSFPPRMNE